MVMNMSAATITTKGQITIPKKVQDNLHVSAGDKVEFVKLDNNRYEIIAATRDIRQLKGIIKNSKQVPISIEEMNAAIAKMSGTE